MIFMTMILMIYQIYHNHYTITKSIIFFIMFVVYTSPVKFTTDENHARIIAEDHYEKTREIVAIEEIDTTNEFYTTSLSY